MCIIAVLINYAKSKGYTNIDCRRSANYMFTRNDYCARYSLRGVSCVCYDGLWAMLRMNTVDDVSIVNTIASLYKKVESKVFINSEVSN